MRRSSLLVAAFGLFACTLPAASQTVGSATADTWQHYYAMLADDEEVESGTADDTYDMLADLAAHKMNVNTATREDLERLPFLTEGQVMDIMEYADRYGPLRSVAELSLVRSLDVVRCRLLSFFVYAGERHVQEGGPRLDSLLSHGHHELTAAVRIPFYDRRGDRDGYLGPKYKHWLRYRFGSGRRLEAGITASQDAGEPFFAGRNKAGYDFYSFYVVARDMGRLRTVAAGRFKARMGMGLVMNSDYSFGKSFALSSLSHTGNTLRAHSSRTEANYLQGVGATVALSRHAELTALVSHRLIDATLNADSTTVKTILTTGYHRTESEMERRRNTSQTTAATSLALRYGGVHVALQGVVATFGRRLLPDTSAVFRRHYPMGRTFANGSLSYSYSSPRLTVAGETATGSSGGLATLNTVQLSPLAELTLTLIQRYYSYRYNAIHASSFSDGGSINNEHGLYAGITWAASPSLRLSAYTDYARSPWPRYQVCLPSTSWDNVLSAVYMRGAFSLSARYRLRMRQRDDDHHAALVDRNEHRARLAVTWRRTGWYSTTQADMSVYSSDGQSRGWMVSQICGLSWRRLMADAMVAYFDTDSYDSRVYMYERGLLYAFSFPVLYGEGIRYAVRLRCDVSPALMLMAKYSVTDWFDRSHTGSGLQQVDRSSTPVAELQLRWRL